MVCVVLCVYQSLIVSSIVLVLQNFNVEVVEILVRDHVVVCAKSSKKLKLRGQNFRHKQLQ